MNSSGNSLKPITGGERVKEFKSSSLDKLPPRQAGLGNYSCNLGETVKKKRCQVTGNSMFVLIFKEREKLHSGNHKLLSFIPTPHKILDCRIKEEIGNS